MVVATKERQSGPIRRERHEVRERCGRFGIMKPADIIAHLKAWLTSLPEGHPVTEKIKELIELTENMTTLHDLKQALDSGAVLIDNKGNTLNKRNDEYWYDPAVHEYGGAYPTRLDWIVPTPSDWRIRDQITTEPTIMAVPIAEWNALQEELKELRGEKKMTTEMLEWWKKTLPC